MGADDVPIGEGRQNCASQGAEIGMTDPWPKNPTEQLFVGTRIVPQVGRLISGAGSARKILRLGCDGVANPRRKVRGYLNPGSVQILGHNGGTCPILRSNVHILPASAPPQWMVIQNNIGNAALGQGIVSRPGLAVDQRNRAPLAPVQPRPSPIGAGRPGLVHISELAHGYIRSPEDAVTVGEEVEVKVLSVNRRRKQIKLSIKATMENPIELAKKIQKPERQSDEPDKPTPTAMEMAMRQAMEKSQDEEEGDQPKETKEKSPNNQELEGILTRTMEHKVKTNS